jgi:hypothetical protein
VKDQLEVDKLTNGIGIRTMRASIMKSEMTHDHPIIKVSRQISADSGILMKRMVSPLHMKMKANVNEMPQQATMPIDTQKKRFRGSFQLSFWITNMRRYKKRTLSLMSALVGAKMHRNAYSSFSTFSTIRHAWMGSYLAGNPNTLIRREQARQARILWWRMIPQ